MKTKINKRFFVLLTLFFSIGGSGTKLDYKNGAFTDFVLVKPISVEDVQQITFFIDKGGIVPNKLYTLESGNQFRMSAPQLWAATMIAILTKVKGSVVEKLRPEMDSITIVDWGDNISEKTRNYFIKPDGSLGHVDNYAGGKGVRVVLYRGRPVLKVGKPCFNPNYPKELEMKSINRLKDDSYVSQKDQDTCTELKQYDSVVYVYQQLGAPINRSYASYASSPTPNVVGRKSFYEWSDDPSPDPYSDPRRVYGYQGVYPNSQSYSNEPPFELVDKYEFHKTTRVKCGEGEIKNIEKSYFIPLEKEKGKKRRGFAFNGNFLLNGYFGARVIPSLVYQLTEQRNSSGSVSTGNPGGPKPTGNPGGPDPNGGPGGPKPRR